MASDWPKSLLKSTRSDLVHTFRVYTVHMSVVYW